MWCVSNVIYSIVHCNVMLLRLSGIVFRIRRWSKRPKWSPDWWLLSWVRQNIIKYWGQRTKDSHVRLILVKMAYYKLLQIISHQGRGKQHHSCVAGVAQWAGRGSENICDGLCYCLARWHRGPVPRCKYILIWLIITHPSHHNTDYST